MDLTFFYSGGKTLEEFQDDPLKSVGGLKSSIMIPNGRFDNLFDEAGIYEVQVGQEINRCIFIKNTKGSTITNLSLYITGKQDFETIEFAVELPDVNGAVQMLNSQFDTPYNNTFYEAYIEADEVILKASLAANETIALWLKRKIDITTERKLTTTLSLIFNYT